VNIAFVVSGGDAPGINAALHHFASQMQRFGESLIGVEGGFPGLLEENYRTYSSKALIPWAAMPGSILTSSRVPVLAQDDARQKLAEVIKRGAIDALVIFGGDGTLKHIPPLLASWGVACIGIPTTIDNDVPGSEYTLGFDSACNFALPIIDGIRATGAALGGRIFTVETLGGNSGFLALEIARAVGADAVALPEYPADIAKICDKLAWAARHKGQALLVYTEGVANKEELLATIPERTGIRIRSTALGHAQRGGTPTARDRAFAAQAALAGYYAIKRGMTMGMTIVQDGEFVLHEGTLEGFEPRKPDPILYERINRLG
jgi:6-phosphofructokinase 1